MNRINIKKCLVFVSLVLLTGCASAVRVKNIAALPAIVPQSGESKPVMLKKVAAKIQRGRVVGSIQGGLMCMPFQEYYWITSGQVRFSIDELSEVLTDELTKNSYTVVGDPTALFEDESEWKAEYLIGALITDLNANICFPWSGYGNFNKAKGEASIKVEWQIWSRRTRSVVLQLTTEGSGKVKHEMPLGDSEVFLQAFSMAVNNLLADRKFFELVALDKDVPERKTEDRETLPIEIKYKKINDSDTKGKFVKGKMVDEIRKASVTIYAGNGWGSGFLISDDGFILTNAHVVGGANFVQVKLVTGSERTGEVIRRNKARDIALVKLENDLYPYSIIGNSANVSVSDEVYAIGTPQKEEYANTVSKGIISSFRVEDGIRYIQSDVNVHPGNSGGPLISEEYGVVGITVAGLMSSLGGSSVGMGLNYFIPIEEAFQLLNIKKKE